MFNDPYHTLGLEHTASDEEVKAAYKRLAMKYHPDRNKDPAAEEKFKEINAAYEKIQKGDTDPVYKFDINEFRRKAADKLFEELIREARYRHQMQVRVTASLTLRDAVTGGEQYMKLPIMGRPEIVKVNVPIGIKHGETVRYPKLAKGVDVVIDFRVLPDPIWSRDGNDLVSDHDICIWDLILGCDLRITRLDRSFVTIKVPPRTQPGTVMRVKGMGIKFVNNPGDLLIRLQGKIPKSIPDTILAELQKLKG